MERETRIGQRGQESVQVQGLDLCAFTNGMVSGS